MKWVLGVDIGGTSVKAAPVWEDGKTENWERAAVGERERTMDGMIDCVGSLYKKIRDEIGKDACGIGIGVPGVVEQPKGIVRQSPQFPQWKDFELKARISALHAGLAVAVENDVNAIAVGEHWTGAAAGEPNFIIMCIGTGLGGALYLNGRLHTGVRGMAGEIGHMCVEPFSDRKCNCGSSGCLERYVSQVGFIDTIEKCGGSRLKSLFTGVEKDKWPEKLYNMAVSGDPDALKIFEDAGYYLGVVIGSLINLLDLELVVIGGGVGKSFALFEKPMKESIKTHSFKAISDRCSVVPAKLWEMGGVVGSAALAFGQSGIIMA